MKFKMDYTSLGSDTEAVVGNNGNDTWIFVTTILFSSALRSSGLLRNEQWQFLNVVSGKPIGPILKNSDS
jgi:hypothetical protein